MPRAAQQEVLQVRSASFVSTCMVLLLWLGFGIWTYVQAEDEIAARRLLDAVSTEPEFLHASCRKNNYRSGPRAFLTKTYAYVPIPASGPQRSYEVDDPIPYGSLEECEAELDLAGSKFRRLHVWYDRSLPWKARWTLDEPSSSPILWLFGAGAVVILWLAMAANRKGRTADASGEHDG